MTITLDALVHCDSKWKAVIGGAAVAYAGLDYYIPVPSALTLAAAGAGVDAYCRGEAASPQQMAMCALGGYVGGTAVRMVQFNTQLPRIVTGPLL